MLKRIPSESPDPEDLKKIKKELNLKNFKNKKKRKSQGNKSPNSKLQKKSSIISKAEHKIIRSVGFKLISYGQKAFRTNEEFQKIIREVQRSVIYLQKQQRKFIREVQKRKKK